MSNNESIMAYVARVDSQKEIELGLHQECIDRMKCLHDTEFGQISPSAPREFTFVHESENPLTEGEEVIGYFSHLLEERRSKSCPLILAINHWDGLTSNKMAFVQLLQYGAEHESGIHLHVLPRGSHEFVDVNVDEVCSVLMKEINPHKAKDTLSTNTMLFIQEFKMAFDWARARHLPEARQVRTSARH